MYKGENTDPLRKEAKAVQPLNRATTHRLEGAGFSSGARWTERVEGTNVLFSFWFGSYIKKNKVKKKYTYLSQVFG